MNLYRNQLFLIITSVVLYSCNPFMPINGNAELQFDDNTESSESSPVSSDTGALPELSELSPWGDLNQDIGEVVLSLKTDKRSMCKYDIQDKQFNSLGSYLFPDADGVSHQVKLKVEPKKNYKYYVRCLSEGGLESFQAKSIEFSTMGNAAAGDITPPMISNSLPIGVLQATNSIEIRVSSNEKSSCMYDTAFKSYTLMTQKLDSNDGLSHSKLISVAPGMSYLYFVHCSDESNNITSTPAMINFSVQSAAVEDKIGPLLSMIAPTGDLASGTTNIPLSFSTNELSDCRYSSTNLPFDQMNALQTTGNLSHLSTISGLEDGKSYTYYLLCQDKLKNQSSLMVAQFRVLAKEADLPPIITSLSPMSVTLQAGVAQVNMLASTNEAANCRYSQSPNTAFAQMLPMSQTGQTNHSHVLPAVIVGVHVYYVACADSKSNVSQLAMASYTVPAIEQVDINTLRTAARKVFDDRCINCHGTGKAYANKINLSRDIQIIEQDTEFITPRNLAESRLYQLILPNGSMGAFINNDGEREAIKKWIEAIPVGGGVVNVNCGADEVALDNVCYKKSVPFRSHGYRMLTLEEIYKSLNTVFKVSLSNYDANGDEILPKEKLKEGFLNQHGLVAVTAPYVQAFEILADKLVSTLDAQNDLSNIVSCYSQAIATCAPIAAKELTEQLFRQSLPAEDLAVFSSFLIASKEEKEKAYLSFFKALVLSPSFLFREEHGVNPNPLYSLNSFEIASRMAFFLTGSAPDKLLIAAAQNNSLLQKAGREAQALRIMATESSQNHLSDVFLESIGVKDLEHEAVVASDMMRESRMLLSEIFFTDGKKWTDVFTAGHTYVNSRLAATYQIASNPGNNNFVKVNYPNNQRVGILSHGSYLGAFYDKGDEENTKDIRRGLSIMTNILCEIPKPLPLGVDPDDDPAANAVGCKLEKRRTTTSNPAGQCIACHGDFDSIGMGFERFNEFGVYRATEKADPSCSTIAKFHTSAEQSYDTMAQFATAIKENTNAQRCLAVKMKTYAYGTHLDISKVNQTFVEMPRFKESLSFKDLILDIVGDQQFVEREGRQ